MQSSSINVTTSGSIIGNYETLNPLTPEFPSATIPAVFMVLTMLAAALTRKKPTKRLR